MGRQLAGDASVVGMGKVSWTLSPRDAVEVLDHFVGGAFDEGVLSYIVDEFFSLMPLLPLEEYCMEPGKKCALMREVLQMVQVQSDSGSIDAYGLLCELRVDDLWAVPLTCSEYERIGGGGGLLKRIGLGRRIRWENLVDRNPMQRLVRRWMASISRGIPRADALMDAPPDPLLQMSPRGTHHTKMRSPGATTVYIKQSMRFQENVNLCKAFLAKHKAAGRDVFRYEWMNFKRVLQAGGAQWRPVKMSDKSFYKRVYRMDAFSQQSWADAMSRPGAVVLPEAAKQTVAQELALEYFTSVIQPLTYYSLDHPDASPELRHFQVVKIHKGRGRARTMTTVGSLTDKCIISRLGLCIHLG